MPDELCARAIYFLRIGMTAWASVSFAGLGKTRPDLDLSRVSAAFECGDFVYAADLLETEIAPQLLGLACAS